MTLREFMNEFWNMREGDRFAGTTKTGFHFVADLQGVRAKAGTDLQAHLKTLVEEFEEDIHINALDVWNGDALLERIDNA